MADPLFEIPEGYDVVAVESSMAAVRAFCGWHVAPVIEEELILDGPGNYLLMLPTLRLVSLDSLSVEGTEIDAEWSEAGIVESVDFLWASRYRSIMAAITHGYEECPAEIRSVVLGLAQSDTASRVISQTTGPFSVTYAARGTSAPFGIGLYETAILSRYRLPAFL